MPFALTESAKYSMKDIGEAVAYKIGCTVSTKKSVNAPKLLLTFKLNFSIKMRLEHLSLNALVYLVVLILTFFGLLRIIS